MAHHWGYTKDNGPHTWSHVAPASKGLHQSPVDIDTSDVRYDPRLEDQPLEIHYVPENSKTLTNNGHSIQVTIDGTDSLLAGGPFHHKYQAEQFHFHWGKENDRGSEHRIDGNVYPAELHIVHWNTELAATFSEASKTANGLAVLGAFLKIGDENPALQKLIDLFPSISHSGQNTPVPDGFDPADILPHNRSRYWTYGGSLTTPPCYESVRFLIFQDPIEVSADQLDAFRNLHSHGDGEEHGEDEFGGKILDNFRPITPLNDRKVIASFL
jgi:carbonic anhydrase